MKYDEPQTLPGSIWTDWINPIMTGYKLRCCDCGLVHKMEFVAMKVTQGSPYKGKYQIHKLPKKKFRVHFRVARDYRATAAIRRKKRKPCLKSRH